MQNANKGEQTTRRLLINIGFAIEALLQDPRAFVVNSAPSHIDGFNLAGREGLHSFKIAFANLKVVFHHLAKGAKGEVKFRGFRFIFCGKIKD
jgi:hypothetical protein